METIEELEEEWRRLHLLYMEKQEKFKEHAKLLGGLRKGFSQTKEFLDHDEMARELMSISGRKMEISRKLRELKK